MMINTTKKKKKVCVECKSEFEPSKTTQKVCSIKCSISYAKNQSEKKAAKEWTKTKREWKEKNKSKSQKIQDVRKPFQMWIRMRDKDQPCISCGTYNSDIWDGGHYSKAEVYTGMIFNENNCHKQCRKCNKYLDGNESNYRIGLVKRIGEDAVIEIENIRDSLRVYEWSDEELKKIKDKYQKLLNEGR